MSDQPDEQTFADVALPDVILVPMSWEVYQALELEPHRNRGGEAEPPEWLAGDDGPTLFIGCMDGTPVIQHQHAPDDRLYVAQLGRLARFREQPLRKEGARQASISGTTTSKS